MKTQWILKNTYSLDESLKEILKERGVDTEEALEEYFSSKPLLTHDPFLLKNLELAVEQILGHIEKKSLIYIYGDYDVDGVCSTVLLVEFLKALTPHVHYYIPSRMEEGYGLNKHAFDHIHKEGGALVITVDCGITSYEEVAYGKALGLDIIVTDHHTPGDVLPETLIVNPKQEGCPYPNKNLCGCGVAFKLIQGMVRKTGIDKNHLKKPLDLVALATVADIVPLIGENRTFVKYGLKEINKKQRKGLAYLIQALGKSEKSIGSYELGFLIGPHINAGGRMAEAINGVKLLLSDDNSEIEILGDLMIEDNKKRRAIQEETLDKIIDLVEEKHKKEKFLVIDGASSHEGVLGIVAGKIKDIYYKPTVIVTASGEPHIYKGTGRSIEDFDLYEALKEMDFLFEKFGGHKAACGFSIKEEHIDTLRKGLNDHIELLYIDQPEVFEKKLYSEAEVEIDHINVALVEKLQAMEPFGMGNVKPNFILKNAEIASVYYMGAHSQYAKIIVSQEKKTLEAMVFNDVSEYKALLNPGNKLDLIGQLGLNQWKGKTTVQFVVKDLRLAESV